MLKSKEKEKEKRRKKETINFAPVILIAKMNINNFFPVIRRDFFLRHLSLFDDYVYI